MREAPLAELAVERLGDRARAVELVDATLHRLGDPRAGLGAAVDLFVADAPQNDARVVAALADQPVELAHAFRIARHLPGLVHDENAHPVAGVEDGAVGGVMRRAIGVAAHRLELLEPPDVQAVGHREADAGMILVVAGALDLDRLAVEEKAVVRIEADAADAEPGLVAVDDGVGDDDVACQRVELRRLQRP